MKFVPIILVAIAAFVIGISLKDSLVLPFNQVSEKNSDVSDTVQLTEEQAALMGIADSPEVATAPGKTFSQNGNSYTSKNLPDKVVMSGLYKLSSYNVNFSISLPKNGGEIAGNLTGTCEGKITGTAEKPNAEGFAPLRGEYSGNCKPIPTLGFKTRISGTFEGKADFNNNKVAISAYNKEPFSNGGNMFEMHF